jgi:hypothetical protein
MTARRAPQPAGDIFVAAEIASAIANAVSGAPLHGLQSVSR